LPPVPELVGWQGAKALLNDVFLSTVLGNFSSSFVVLTLAIELMPPLTVSGIFWAESGQVAFG